MLETTSMKVTGEPEGGWEIPEQRGTLRIGNSPGCGQRGGPPAADTLVTLKCQEEPCLVPGGDQDRALQVNLGPGELKAPATLLEASLQGQ